MCFRTEMRSTGRMTAFAPVFRPNLPGLSGMSRLWFRRGLLLLTLCLLTSQVSGADRSGGEELRTGRQLQQALESRRALTVQAIPLRDLLADLQTQSGICIVLDRRIDPSQRLTLNADLMPTLHLLHLAAAEIPQAAVSVNQSFVYIGPVDAAHRLRTLCELNRKMILDARSQLDAEVYVAVTSRLPVAWEELSRPAEVLTRLCAETGLDVSNVETVPPDLWHAGQWSKMSLAESATLLLNQFDLTFRVDPAGAQVEVIRLPETVVLDQRHSVPRRQRETVRQLLPTKFPELTFDWKPSSVQVAATYEQHQQIAALLTGKGTSESAPADSLKTRLFSLTLPDNITWNSLIEQLQNSGIAVRIEGDLQGQLDDTVSVALSRLPGKEFFPRLFAGLPVDVEVRDAEVVLRVSQ